MVLMETKRDVRIDRLERFHHLGQHEIVRIGAGAAARLDDDGALGLLGRVHNGEALLHIVDVEGGHAVAMLGGVIQKLPQGNSCHLR